MRMDYKLILDMNLHKIRQEFDKNIKENNGYFNEDLIIEMYEKYGELFDIAKQFNNNFFQRKSRVYKRIKSIIEDELPSYFLTLTFNDDVLYNTKKKTRREYVSKFLKNNYVDYVANIDFGDENEREHYHAVVLSQTLIKGRSVNWYYGFSNKKKIRNTTKSHKKITNYLLKLTNHAMKTFMLNDRFIYCRKKRNDN